MNSPSKWSVSGFFLSSGGAVAARVLISTWSLIGSLFVGAIALGWNELKAEWNEVKSTLYRIELIQAAGLERGNSIRANIGRLEGEMDIVEREVRDNERRLSRVEILVGR